MKRFIPFWCLPMSWGLRGQTRFVREAEYYLQGLELERRLVEITEKDHTERRYLNLDLDLKYDLIEPYEYDVAHATIAYTDTKKLERALLDIDHKHGRLAAYDHEVQCAKLDHQARERDIALLEIERKYGKIDDAEYKRQLATFKEEPYIAITKSEYDPRQGMNGLYFEFDWNELWIDYLRLNGYVGMKDEEIVEEWFNDICRAVARENPEEDTSNVPFNSGRIIRQVRDGDATEYS